jgi:hypothetical protein
MHRRTVGRAITEAGIKVRLQLGHEMVRAKGGAVIRTLLYFFFFDIVGFQAVCLSSDGTSHRNVKYEARHLT